MASKTRNWWGDEEYEVENPKPLFESKLYKMARSLNSRRQRAGFIGSQYGNLELLDSAVQDREEELRVYLAQQDEETIARMVKDVLRICRIDIAYLTPDWKRRHLTDDDLHREYSRRST